MNNFILSTCLLFCYFLPTFAQAARTEAADTVTTETPDTKEARRQRVAQRNLHYNILGGPGYTPDFGVVLGATALMTFRTAPEDTLLQRSVVPLTLAYMFKGSGVNLMVRPQFFFRDDRFRIFGTFSWKNTVENYYGVGYSTNRHTERGENNTEYSYSGFQINPQFMFRVGETDFFIGPQLDVNYDDISSPAAGIAADPSYIADGGPQRTATVDGDGFIEIVLADGTARQRRGKYLFERAHSFTPALSKAASTAANTLSADGRASTETILSGYSLAASR